MCTPDDDYPCPDCIDGKTADGKDCRLCGGTGVIDMGNFNPTGEEEEL
jgi:hypothetical protein